MSLVYKVKLGCPLRKAVALKLADCSDDTGENIWPAVSTIADQAEISERTVQNKLADLLAMGIIDLPRDETGEPIRGGGRYKTTVYHFCMARLYDIASGRAEVVETDDGPRIVEKGAAPAPFHSEQNGAAPAPFHENGCETVQLTTETPQLTTERVHVVHPTLHYPSLTTPPTPHRGGEGEGDRQHVKRAGGGRPEVEDLLDAVVATDPSHAEPVALVLGPICRQRRFDAPNPAFALGVLAGWLAKIGTPSAEVATAIVFRAIEGRKRTVGPADIEAAVKIEMGRAAAARRPAAAAPAQGPARHHVTSANVLAWPRWLESLPSEAAARATAAGTLEATSRLPLPGARVLAIGGVAVDVTIGGGA